MKYVLTNYLIIWEQPTVTNKYISQHIVEKLLMNIVYQ